MTAKEFFKESFPNMTSECFKQASLFTGQHMVDLASSFAEQQTKELIRENQQLKEDIKNWIEKYHNVIDRLSEIDQLKELVKRSLVNMSKQVYYDSDWKQDAIKLIKNKIE